MFESVINFLSSDILFRIMVFIWMVTMTYWLKNTSDAINDQYKDMLKMANAIEAIVDRIRKT